MNDFSLLAAEEFRGQLSRSEEPFSRLVSKFEACDTKKQGRREGKHI
jgi:hypothetical protein